MLGYLTVLDCCVMVVETSQHGLVAATKDQVFIADCRLSIEEVTRQLLPMSISNRQSTIGNPSHPRPSDDREKSSPHEKKMKTSATARRSRNQHVGPNGVRPWGERRSPLRDAQNLCGATTFQELVLQTIPPCFFPNRQYVMACASPTTLVTFKNAGTMRVCC